MIINKKLYNYVIRNGSLMSATDLKDNERMFDSFTVSDHIYDFFKNNGMLNEVYDIYFQNIRFAISNFTEKNYDRIAMIISKSLASKPEIEIYENCFKVNGRKYKINETIFLKVKKIFDNLKEFKGVSGAMELKTKRNFDSLGDVYEKFRENKDVFLTNQQIYDLFEVFWEKNCCDLKSEEHPNLFIVGAQPGAGKTGLVTKIQSETKLPILTGDQYRVYHPNVFSFLKNDSYTEYTSPINFLMCMLTIARCFDKNISFIIENPLKNPIQNIDYMEEAIKRNYSVNFLLMAVSKFDSFLGVYNRGANLIKAGNMARFTSHKTHDEGYDGVLKTLDFPEIISKLNSIAIYNRKLETIFELKNKDLLKNTELKISLIKTQIEKERLRPHTKDEMDELEKQKLMVLDYIDKGLISIDKSTFLKELESRKVDEKSIKL